MELREYQKDISNLAYDILLERGIVYLTMEVRTGKTLTSLEIAKLYGADSVVFLTKKKAIDSILSDWQKFGYDQIFDIEVINDESMHKIENIDCDLVIHDEHHRFGGFPKPGKYTKMFRKMFSEKPMILMYIVIRPLIKIFIPGERTISRHPKLMVHLTKRLSRS